MATPRYLSVDALKAWMRDEVTADDNIIEDAINAAEMMIDNALQRRMIVATSGSARVYAPTPGSDVLYIHDATTVTAVVEDGTTLVANTDYQREPLNNLSAAGEVWPFSRIQRLSGSWYTDAGKSTITVTGTWGWAAIPFEVVESCKIVAQDMLEYRNVRFGQVAITDVGGVGSRENMVVKSMIAKYRGVNTFGIA